MKLKSLVLAAAILFLNTGCNKEPDKIQSGPQNGETISATIETAKGTIKLQLYKKKTPNTVENFCSLAKKGSYNGLFFHRVMKDFMIQGGCPQGTGSGNMGNTIDCEIVHDLKHTRGVISMAHRGICEHNPTTGKKIGGECTNGSQFYITHVPTPWLDGKHTVFGYVTEGMDVVDKIQQGDKILKVTID